MLKKILKALFAALTVLFILVLVKFKSLGVELKTEAIAKYLTVSENKNDIQLTYLGCAGFIIEKDGKSILCDPYFSNPGLFDFGNKNTAWTKYVDEKKLKSINLVTISHGHYDHCYDIEDLCSHLPPNSKIIGDISVQNQLHSIYKNKNLLEEDLLYTKAQNWIYNKDSSFRILALQSIHNPHVANIEFLKGKYTEPLNEIPKNAWQWKKGEAYSFLIDFMHSDSVTYRIILVNGGLNEDAISVLKQLSKERKSDLQLQIFWKEALVTENMNLVYGIIKPDKIILHHWTNFFVSLDKPLQYLKDSHLPEVLKKYNEKGIPVSVMLPFTSVQL